MKTMELGQTASANLLETYFALGAAAPASTIRREAGYRICLSQANHPISNFAADLQLDANAAAKLAQIAAHRPSFHVYRLPTDLPRHSAELLQQAGFRVGHTLTQMAWMPAAAEALEPPALAVAETTRERERIAGFMTEQFFSRQPHSFRRQVLDGTVRAGRLQLAGIEERGRIIGAVMLCRTPDSIGIYNLCVAASLRNRGIGREIVDTLKVLAIQERKALVLQCEGALTPWYRKQGFNSVGFVEVFGFPAGSPLDIM